MNDNKVHPLLEELLNNKGDQVASMLTAGLRGWLEDSNPWVKLTEGRYDRDKKGKSVTFSIFSNLGEFTGGEVKEEPIMQLEVDRYTKKHQPIGLLPHNLGVAKQMFEYPTMRDMVYPYLFILTILMRQRMYPMIGYSLETKDKPLIVELFGGQCIWRVVLWQNRIIREYNEAVKLKPELALPRETFGEEEDDDEQPLAEPSNDEVRSSRIA